MNNLKVLVVITSLLFLAIFSYGQPTNANGTVFVIDSKSVAYQGTSSTPVKAKRPRYFNNVAICRIQLRVTTNTIKNSNSDSKVWTQLHSDDRRFYLNLSKDDREKGRTDTYDVMSANINKIGDIKMIKIGISGEDAWNVRKIDLIINGAVIFTKNYSSKGKWIDLNSNHASSLAIYQLELRQSPKWKYNSSTTNIWKAPKVLSARMLRDLVESAVGNVVSSMNNNTVGKVKWGKKFGSHYIEYKVKDIKTLSFDLDLKYDVPNAPDAEIDVNFDMNFHCIKGVVKVYITNVKTSTDKIGKAYKFLKFVGLKALSAKFDKEVEKSVGDLLDFNFDYTIPNVNLRKNCTGRLHLDKSGNLHL